jgi:hypothetical protein
MPPLERFVIVIAVAASSLGAVVIGTRWLGLRSAALTRGLGMTLEAIGLAVVFFVANIAAGTAFIIATRMMTGWFVSVYVMDDLVLPLLSLFEAMIFQAWRRS